MTQTGYRPTVTSDVRPKIADAMPTASSEITTLKTKTSGGGLYDSGMKNSPGSSAAASNIAQAAALGCHPRYSRRCGNPFARTAPRKAVQHGCGQGALRPDSGSQENAATGFGRVTTGRWKAVP
jgi:hypothetical protein